MSEMVSPAEQVTRVATLVGTSGAAVETRERTIVRNLGNRLGLSTQTA
jgi:tellurite resistance protein